MSQHIPSPNDYLPSLPPSQLTPTMTFYGTRGAPNPRRVEIFFAEHHMYENKQYNYVNINLKEMEHKKNGKYATPNQKVPMLTIEYDPDPEQQPHGEGVLVESVAICKYIEERDHVSGACLFGFLPMEKATIEMWTRRIEFELFLGAVGKAWLQSPLLQSLRKKKGLADRPNDYTEGVRLSHTFYNNMERILSKENYGAYIAGGDRFSVADITLLCVLDFGSGLVGIIPKWKELPYLKKWYQLCCERESIQKYHPNPYLKSDSKM